MQLCTIDLLSLQKDEPLITTERLSIRRFNERDADFIVELLNDPDFLAFIGDKQVRTRQDAIRYLREGPLKSYQEHGFGLYLMLLTRTQQPVGMCGVLKRPGLPTPDLGYALLPTFRHQGLVFEACEAVLKNAQEAHQLQNLAAITSPDNQPSIAVLEKLGFRFVKRTVLPGDNEEVNVFEWGQD